PFLVRLFLDVRSRRAPNIQLSDNESAMHDAIKALSAIQEFCCTKYSLQPDTIPPWKTVRRVAMAGSWINNKPFQNLSEMEALKKCILAWPDALLIDNEFKLSVIQGDWATVQATELVMVISDPSYWVLRGLKAAWITEGALGGRKRGGRATLKVMEVPHTPVRPREGPEAWNILFSRIVLDGFIWNLCTETWDIYSRRINVDLSS
ncbi:hypothetical protein FRB93_010625, partial [Tulasnella sp. JGI-2019a]